MFLLNSRLDLFSAAHSREHPFSRSYGVNLPSSLTTDVYKRQKQDREVEQNPKRRLSSDCRLQLACMKVELLVIADQHAAVNTFPGLVHTARHTMGVGNTRSQ